MDAVNVGFFGSEGKVRLDLGADIAEKLGIKEILNEAVFVASCSMRRYQIHMAVKRLLTAESHYIACDICLLPAEGLVGIGGSHWLSQQLFSSQVFRLDRLQPFASLRYSMDGYCYE